MVPKGEDMDPGEVVPPPPRTTKASGTHLTGMLSCFISG